MKSVTTEKIVQCLQYLGIDGSNHRILCILPMVEVAWADGLIQEAERTLILGVVEDYGLVDSDARRLIEGWLVNRPSEEYFRRGRLLLRLLLEQQLGRKLMLPLQTPEAVLAHCLHVADAAGGYFGGRIGRVSPEEKVAIASVAKALRVERYE